MTVGGGVSGVKKPLLGLVGVAASARDRGLPALGAVASGGGWAVVFAMPAGGRDAGSRPGCDICLWPAAKFAIILGSPISSVESSAPRKTDSRRLGDLGSCIKAEGFLT